MGCPTALKGLVLLAIAPIQGPSDPPTARPLPPLKPIAGIAGIESVSTIVYPSAPDRPHELRTTYVFPERVRWQISVKGGKADERVLQYRSGENVYRVPMRSGNSEACTGEDRTQTLLQMELRRAVMLYPDGFEWKGEGTERRADLGELGSLFALGSSANDKKPHEMGSAGSDGKKIDSYENIRWREKDGRAWPESMELWHSGELAWKETVESVSVQGRFVDSFFVPPDRRDRSKSEPAQGDARELDLPATCSLRVEISKGANWDAALLELTRLRADWSKRLADLKLELEPNATMEASWEGEPTAVVLRLSTTPESPPEGFVKAGVRKGIAVAVAGLKEATSTRLAVLRKALPAGSVAGIPYVRFDPRTGADGRVLVVVPYSKTR